MPNRQPPRVSPHSITAVMAIITAVIALGVGVWENVQMREHNRLAVTPHLQLTAEFHSADVDSLDRGIIRVSNQGVGPAVIERVEVMVTGADGQEQRFETWGEARALLKELDDVHVSRRAELGPGAMFGAGEALELARFEKASTAEEPLFPSLLDRLDVRIFYHSVYGESFETDLARQRSHAGV
jgi:hypothetical protein